MDNPKIIILIAIVVAVFIALFLFLKIRSRGSSGFRSMMNAESAEKERVVAADRAESVQNLKRRIDRGGDQKKLTLQEKLFQAGLFLNEEKRDFNRLRIIAPIVFSIALSSICFYVMGIKLALVGLILGVLLGMQLPYTYLDRLTARRGEEMLFYLPLVIEQISIGVSSSLDIGPCVERIVSMADERESHNVVTELLKYALAYIKSGVSFDESVVEIGKATGHTEFKHAMMFLAQVSRHGGEVTRQLQELADSVARQREVHIEEQINKLELKATFPLTLVFAGFLIILLTGFGTNIAGALG